MKLKLLIPLLTFVSGIFSFSLFALLTNSFWFHSSVDIPILKLPTLYIGDTFFLPLFNFYLLRLYEKTRRELNYKKYSSSFKFFFVIAIILSFTINYYQHIEWTKDNYTGFIDLKLNMLSGAGWWHLIFASLEMTVMLLFLWLFVIIILEKNLKGFVIIKKLCWVFFLYSGLSILDFIIKEKFVANEPHLMKAFLNNLFEIKVFYLGTILLVFYYFIKLRIFTHQSLTS